MMNGRFEKREDYMSNPKWLCAPCFGTNAGAFGAFSQFLVSLSVSQGSFAQRYGFVMLSSLRSSAQMPLWELLTRSHGGNAVENVCCGAAASAVAAAAVFPASLLFGSSAETKLFDRHVLLAGVKTSALSGLRLGLFVSFSRGEDLSSSWKSLVDCFLTASAAGAFGSIPIMFQSRSLFLKEVILFGTFMTLYERLKLLAGIPTTAMTKY